MIRMLNRNVLLPGAIGTAVLGIALTLLTLVVRSPYTHANLNPGYDPRYTRTMQMFVGAPVPLSHENAAVPLSYNPIARGRQLFVMNGCASCHGLDGDGGVVGPSIVGTNAAMLRTATNEGPGGMLPYAPGALSDQDLSLIAGYLAATVKPTAQAPAPTQAPAQGQAPAQPTAQPQATAQAPVVPANASAGGTVSFSGQILPILQANCSSCHGADAKYGAFDVSSYASVMAGGKDGPVIVPGDLSGSLLAVKILRLQPKGKPMPPKAPLATSDLMLILNWISAGAPNN